MRKLEKKCHITEISRFYAAFAINMKFPSASEPSSIYSVLLSDSKSVVLFSLQMTSLKEGAIYFHLIVLS